MSPIYNTLKYPYFDILLTTIAKHKIATQGKLKSNVTRLHRNKEKRCFCQTTHTLARASEVFLTQLTVPAAADAAMLQFRHFIVVAVLRIIYVFQYTTDF